MINHVNEIHLIGVVNKDPNVRHFEKSMKTEINLLTEVDHPKRDGGVYKRKVFHNVESWNDADSNISKGDIIEVLGLFDFSSWEDNKTGKKMYRKFIKAKSIKILEKIENKNFLNNEVSSSHSYDGFGDIDNIPF
jgi:single-stranded DNA-binding protein